MVPVPTKLWQALAHHEVAGSGGHTFMTRDHHRVRDFAVLALPRAGRPLPPAYFAEHLGLPVERVVSILDELEAGMTFVFRNEAGAVTWAYPVTVDRTPHRVAFETGEQVYAA
jgi:hypothetical protein